MHELTHRAILLTILAIASVAPGVWASPRGCDLASRIPEADRPLIDRVSRTEWRNPRVLVDTEFVFVLLDGKGLGRNQKPAGDLADALCRLPKRSWPYGRAVALALSPRLGRLEPDVRERRLAEVRRAIEPLGLLLIETPVGCDCGDGHAGLPGG